jgi:mycothiol maleylpyruvate isomerase-like protein
MSRRPQWDGGSRNSLRGGLLQAEDAAWAEFRALTLRLSPEQTTQVGYQHDWSVKDLLAHMACWDAEAAQVLEQLRLGTYQPWDANVDEFNRECFDACRGLDLDTVWAQLHSSRARMLEELGCLPDELLERGNKAWEWFEESGVTHHDEHLPRLREWVELLQIPE